MVLLGQSWTYDALFFSSCRCRGNVASVISWRISEQQQNIKRNGIKKHLTIENGRARSIKWKEQDTKYVCNERDSGEFEAVEYLWAFVCMTSHCFTLLRAHTWENENAAALIIHSESIIPTKYSTHTHTDTFCLQHLNGHREKTIKREKEKGRKREREKALEWPWEKFVYSGS